MWVYSVLVTVLTFSSVLKMNKTLMSLPSWKCFHYYVSFVSFLVFCPPLMLRYKIEKDNVASW